MAWLWSVEVAVLMAITSQRPPKSASLVLSGKEAMRPAGADGVGDFFVILEDDDAIPGCAPALSSPTPLPTLRRAA